MKRLITLLAMVALMALSASAQSYNISWYKVAGGGGTSSGGQYSLSGTIGQPDASGSMSGGSYSMTGGFWSLISVVQTAGMPQLCICSSGNKVTVYWQNVSGCTLQESSNPGSPNWTSCGYTVNTSNGTNSITINSASGNMFFRLAKP